VVVDRLPSPYTDCKTLVEFSGVPNITEPITGYSYFQLDCYDLCRRKTVMRACGKYEEFMTIMPYFYKDHLQFTSLYLRLETGCPREVIEAAKNKFKVHGEVRLCNECPIECNSVNYEINAFYQIERDRSIKPSQVKIQIYYERMDHTRIVQLAKMGPADMLSILGGTAVTALIKYFLFD